MLSTSDFFRCFKLEGNTGQEGVIFGIIGGKDSAFEGTGALRGEVGMSEVGKSWVMTF